MARRLEEAIFRGLMLLASWIMLGALALLIIVITIKGARALSWEMLTQVPSGGYYLGKEGGILNAILGSLALAVGATGGALICALPVALFLQSDYSGRSRLATMVRACLDLLWGVPSIVYGAFGFTLLLLLGMRASLLGGIIALTLVEMPIMARAMEEVLRTIPAELKEASYAIGATRWETMRSVVVRQALPGLATAVLLAFGRGIGEAAAVLFTAGYTDNLPRSLFEPVASLPLAVFFQMGTPFPEVQARAHAAALILLGIVLLVAVVSRLLTARLSRNAVR
jgi:phosphate transport system permease protein